MSEYNVMNDLDLKIWDKVAKKYSNLNNALKKSPLALNRGYPDPRVTIHNPNILNIISSIINAKNLKLIDIGCGDGYLTYRISKLVKEVVGLDGSENSLKFAKRYKSRFNIKYAKDNILDSKMADIMKNNFDVAVSSMLLMDINDLFIAADNIVKFIKIGGELIISITHPCFFPIGFAEHYTSKKIYHIDISKKYDEKHITPKDLGKFVKGINHYHRPISRYIKLFTERGMLLKGLYEPTLTKNDFSKIPNSKRDYRYYYVPPFLFLHFIKVDN